MYIYIYIFEFNILQNYARIQKHVSIFFNFINYFLVPPILDHLVRSLLVHLHCKLNKLHSYGLHETASKDINISITYYVQNKFYKCTMTSSHTFTLSTSDNGVLNMPCVFFFDILKLSKLHKNNFDFLLKNFM